MTTQRNAARRGVPIARGVPFWQPQAGEVIRSCLGTLRKQGHGMLDVLRRAFASASIASVA